MAATTFRHGRAFRLMANHAVCHLGEIRRARQVDLIEAAMAIFTGHCHFVQVNAVREFQLNRQRLFSRGHLRGSVLDIRRTRQENQYSEDLGNGPHFLE